MLRQVSASVRGPNVHNNFQRIMGQCATRGALCGINPPYCSTPMTSADEQLAIALDFHRAGRVAEAESRYRQILQAHPRHHAALHLLGVVERQRGRRESAIRTIQQAIAVCPTDAGYHNTLGEVFRETGRLGDAQTCFERALTIEPSLATARFNLGLLTGIDEPAEAQQHYERAIALAPEYAPLRVNLANVLRAQGKLDEAVEAYRAAIAERPDDTDALANLGELLSDLGRVDEANEILRRAVGLAHRDISHRHRCIFIHIPKNAGTSIRQALGLVGGGHRPWRYHANTQPQVWRQYISFAVVRNPWDRVVSAYQHAKMQTSHWHAGQSIAHPDYQLLADKSFEECLAILCRQPGRLSHESWLDQTQWIVDVESPDKTTMVQSLLRYETLADDFARFCRRLRVDGQALPTLNTSQRSGDYRSYYSEQTKNMVAQLYAEDIQRFGYAF